MEPTHILTLAIFVLTIFFVIIRKIDTVAVALLGVVVMIIAGSMTDIQAFKYVDWDVMMILISIWVIAAYFGKTGIPEWIADQTLTMSKGNIALFVTLIGTLAGFLSMFIANVTVVLMLAPVLFHIRKVYGFESTGPLLFLGLCSNFMGTALLLGDPPPLMLHSVSGIGFMGFIWQKGRPSSFIILTITYLLVCAIFYFFKFKKSSLSECKIIEGEEKDAHEIAGQDMTHIKDKNFAIVVVLGFILTLIGMSIAQYLGYTLGFVATAGAVFTVIVIEVLRKPLKFDVPDLEHMLTEIEWTAIAFYAALFSLVGALGPTHIFEIMASWFVPFVDKGLLFGTSVLYWGMGVICGFVEHDAFILTVLHVIKDLGTQHGVNVWPYYWSLMWAGTLGSNMTIAGAPALYIALTMGEKEDGKTFSMKEFFSYTFPYVVLSLIICYVLTVLIWVLPFM